MKRLLAAAVFMFAIGGLQLAVAQSDGNGNPRPGSPHDTIMIHVLKPGMSPRYCDGGHSLFLHHEQIADPANNGGPINIYITMTDWVDDGDGTPYDEFGNVEPGEEGGITTAIKCDSQTAPVGEVRLQMRDTEPAEGTISTQEWFARLVGKPGGNFVFTSNAQQVQCSVDPGDDGLFNTEDDIVTCTPDDWVELDGFNLANPDDGSDPCVKKSSGPKRGKTPFCDITSGFLVDVDTDGDGSIDFQDQFVFTVSCLDDPATTEVDESTLCPLTSIIWAIDDDTTSMAKAQIFVGHTGWALIQRGKVRGRN